MKYFIGLKKMKGILFVLPSLLGVIIFYFIPFIESIIYCFTSGMGKRRFVGLNNFKELFSNEVYQMALYNTCKIIGIALPLLCLLSVLVGLLIEKNLKKNKWIQGLLLLPIAIPVASLTLVWKDLFDQNGLINLLLNLNIDWLNSHLAPYIIIVLIVWKNLGYNTLLIIGALLSIPKEYEEAACLDGAGFLKVAWYIKIPNLIPVIFFVVVISLNNCFKVFREIYLLQGAYPNDKLYLLQHFMNNNFTKLNNERLCTSAFILFGIIFMIIYMMCYLQQRYVRSMGGEG